MICQDDRMATQALEKKLGIRLAHPLIGFLAYSEGGPAAFVFNNYTLRDIHVTCAISGPISIADIRFLALYIFGQLGCARITAVIAESNMRARRAAGRIGFKQEGIIREHFPLCDGVLYGLLASEQKIARLMIPIKLKERELT